MYIHLVRSKMKMYEYAILQFDKIYQKTNRLIVIHKIISIEYSIGEKKSTINHADTFFIKSFI